MAIALAFAAVVLGAGFGTLRVLGVAKGALAVGLAPAALAVGLAPATGLALLCVTSSWSTILGWPPPLGGLIGLSLALVGVLGAVRDRAGLRLTLGAIVRRQRLATALLGLAILVPIVVTSIAFVGAEVPLSPHDGAQHAQAIDAHRRGVAWPDWYPPGLPSLFGAALQVVPPSVDTAAGALHLGFSLPPLAALGIFGLGVAVWRDLRMAGAGAMLLGLTYLYPHFPELWSGWPLSLSLILVMGVWVVALAYAREPTWRWAVLGGLLLGAIVLVHGSELYTLGLLLPLLLLANLRHLTWPALGATLAVAAVVAAVCAAPYLPTLLHWAGGGGAYGVGMEDAQVPHAAASVQAGPDPLVVFGLDTLGVDLPLRVALVIVGITWASRRRTGRTLVCVGVLFSALAVGFTLLIGLPLVRQVYALTFPWAMHYRLFMLVALAQALLAGSGLILTAEAARGWLAHRTCWPQRSRRVVGRAGRLLAGTWLLLATWGMGAWLAYPADLVNAYTADDAAAMAWLRRNGVPGSVVANDGFADAGIWAPYKAGLPVLLPRVLLTGDAAERNLVLDNVAWLERAPAAAAAACRLHVAYVYYGAKTSAWDARRFPPVEQFEASPMLDLAFRQGGARVFRLRDPCA